MEIVLAIIGLAIVIVPLWRIAERGGKSGAVSLVVAVPLLGIFVYWLILASSDWGTKGDGQ